MHCTYQLWITVDRPLWLQVGRLGLFSFPAGRYIYTGSARRALAARLARHRCADKRLRWHIDYLLAGPGVRIDETPTFESAECAVNRRTCGEILIKRFGATDCRSGCGSHLKYLGGPRPESA